MKPKPAKEPTPTPTGLTLTAKQLLESHDALLRLANEKPIGNQRMAYNLVRTLRAFSKEFDTLSEQKLEIFKTFGAEQVGAQFLLRSEQMTPEFQAEIKSLLEIPVEIWGHPISFDELAAAQVNLCPADLMALDWMITE